MLKELFLENKAKIGAVLLGMLTFLLFDEDFRQLLRVYPLVNTFLSALTFGLISAGVLRSDKFYKEGKEDERIREYVQREYEKLNDRSQH